MVTNIENFLSPTDQFMVKMTKNNFEMNDKVQTGPVYGKNYQKYKCQK